MSIAKTLKDKKIALIGCGDIGCRLAAQLLEAEAEVFAYRRMINKLPAGVKAYSLDVTNIESVAGLAVEAFDYVVVTLSPAEMSDEAYRITYVEGLKNILAVLNTSRLRKLFWVSSTSVYGQSDGSWIDEHSETKPTRYAGKRQLEAEQQLEILGDKYCVVRFSGIYREGKNRLVEQIKAGLAEDKIENDYFTNRIHVKDCAAVLAHLLWLDATGRKLEQIYLASDSAPIKYSELIHWLTKEISLAKEIGTSSNTNLNSSATTPIPRVGSKRCSNQRLLKSGYQFIYATYKEGFRDILKSY